MICNQVGMKGIIPGIIGNTYFAGFYVDIGRPALTNLNEPISVFSLYSFLCKV
jgi:hypothetical protein